MSMKSGKTLSESKGRNQDGEEQQRQRKTEFLERKEFQVHKVSGATTSKEGRIVQRELYESKVAKFLFSVLEFSEEEKDKREKRKKGENSYRR